MNNNAFLICIPFMLFPFFYIFIDQIFEESILFNSEINAYLSLILVIIIFPIFFGLARKNLDLFEPSVLFMLGVFMGFLIPAFLILNNPDIKGQYQIDYLITQTNFIMGIKYSLLSFTFFTIGYYFFRGKISFEERSASTFSKKRFKLIFSIFIIMYLLGKIIVFIVLGDQEARGLEYEFGFGIFQPFTDLSIFLLITWLVFFVFTKQIKGNFILTFVMVVVFFSSFSITSRGGVLGIALAIFAVINYNYFRLKLWHGFFLLSMAMIPILAIGLSRYDVENTAIDIYVNFISVAYLATFSGLESMIIISEQIPEYMDFYNGNLILGAFILPFFPRIIFTFKPEVYGYNLFWEDYISASTQGKSEYFLSLPGHFFADFGWIGIIVGSFIIGLIYAKIYRVFRMHMHNKGIICLYALACVTIFFQTPLVMPTSMVLLRTFLLPAIFIYIIYSKKSLKL